MSTAEPIAWNAGYAEGYSAGLAEGRRLAAHDTLRLARLEEMYPESDVAPGDDLKWRLYDSAGVGHECDLLRDAIDSVLIAEAERESAAAQREPGREGGGDGENT